MSDEKFELSLTKCRECGIIHNLVPCPQPEMRTFETGATRDSDLNKLDYEGFLSPSVVRRYAEFMHMHRVQPDGKLRSADNWQKGIPEEAYVKSLWRHFMDVWSSYRNLNAEGGVLNVDLYEEALCAVIFNASGLLFESLRDCPIPVGQEIPSTLKASN